MSDVKFRVATVREKSWNFQSFGEMLGNFVICYQSQEKSEGGESEWLNLTAFLGTADSEVHISHVITAYTLESLSSLTYITHNLQATINFKEKVIKKEQQNEDTH